MQVFTKIDEMQSALARAGMQKKISFVPTMGWLHDGHISLLKIAKEYSEKTVVSIFVNPLQFNNPEDLKKYPRDLERDKYLLSENGADYLFIPEENEILPVARELKFYKPSFNDIFEGKFRPGHFEGVCRIVHALFNIAEPGFALFGEKDFQQLRIIEEMNKDLKLGIKIIRAPLIRDPDGLALSSRNARLSSAERKSALCLSRALFDAKNAFQAGETGGDKLKDIALKEIKKEDAVTLEYLALIDEISLEEISKAGVNSRMILAANAGGIRLIDNMPLHHTK